MYDNQSGIYIFKYHITERVIEQVVTPKKMLLIAAIIFIILNVLSLPSLCLKLKLINYDFMYTRMLGPLAKKKKREAKCFVFLC